MLATLGLVVGVLLGALDAHGAFAVEDAPRRMLLLPAGDRGSVEQESGGAREDERAEYDRATFRRRHRTLKLVTTGSLLLTAGLGTLSAINEGTVFHPGRCETGHPLLGDYGCDSLGLVHGASAILSGTLYTATAVYGLSAPGRSVLEEYGPLYRVLSYVHLVGIALQPLLGIISAHPETLGIRGESQEHFSDVVRTVHIGVGIVTVAAYATTTVLEF